ncbi:DUF1772 domain-containing protein [Solwaraspora sp. WMMD406]|uniref:anthrone oxygenase family protein n=1 Tax=Solwaraspora sp. WMMD406 TaxID=3016095 RepID=UPI0024168F40|nr:anthrone oxygenase family protein [Solwaraspora sp. WMMD406]MDG4764162.1 DUF1772 domain-containing protein [Solwaraspora sp. WMMD406]
MDFVARPPYGGRDPTGTSFSGEGADMRDAALITAVISTGLMAGLFLAFSISVMPALARVEDRAFVEVMQLINIVILNPIFGLVFLGALVSNAVAAWQYADQPQVFGWALGGAVGYATTFLITLAVSAPLNYRLDRAGPARQLSDPGAARRAFEKVWVRWHNLRTVANVAAFGCLCIALSNS